MTPRPIDGAMIKRARTQLVSDADLAGRALARRLSQQADSWFESLAADLPPRWSLVATGGYAGGVLCPGSDIDVVLLHPAKTPEQRVREVAERLWYPLWDGGIKLSPAAHTTKSLLQFAADDLETATSILRVRCLAGDLDHVQELHEAAVQQWRRKPQLWLQRLTETGEQRWARYGDVASLLEPDLKDGRGGLRDHDMIRWALAADRAEVTEALECPFEDLAGSAEILLAARCELHRTTGRTANVLLLQEQDRVAETMGYADADTLMLTISSAAHSIEWAGERFWRRVERVTRKGARSETRTARSLADHVPGVTVLDGEVQVSLDADLDEQAFVFRAAAAAAHQGHPLGGRSLRLLASRGYEPNEVWSERTRRAFVSLLGAGQAVVAAVEALEQYDLFSRFLPEWRHVRSRPQRNAFHTYTIDRHLLQTVANASDHVRAVSRPDLLLVGALLHDIGKGRPGDHTDVGMDLVDTIGPRMGFPADDVAVLRSLVEHHLLLSETATRRDLSDPRTALNVADAVGDLGRLELLHALTVADSLATGPAAWSTWKSGLVDELVRTVAERLRGQPFDPDDAVAERRFAHLAEQVRADGALHIEHENVDDFYVLRIASRDRPGLFAVIAGTLAVHGLDVVGADAFTLAGGAAVDEFRIMRIGGGSPNWAKIEHGLLGVLSGEVDIEARLDQRVRTYGRARRRAVAAAQPRLEVLISNDASDSTTMIDVRAPDGVAVLYRLSRTLTGHGVDIRSAKVSTLGHEVVDVFYVQLPGSAGGIDGQIPADRHDAIRSSLKAALVD